MVFKINNQNISEVIYNLIDLLENDLLKTEEIHQVFRCIDHVLEPNDNQPSNKAINYQVNENEIENNANTNTQIFTDQDRQQDEPSRSNDLLYGDEQRHSRIANSLKNNQPLAGQSVGNRLIISRMFCDSKELMSIEEAKELSDYNKKKLKKPIRTAKSIFQHSKIFDTNVKF